MKTALLSLLLAAVAPTVTIHPAQLDRGPDVPGPHVEGRVLVDGSMRMSFRAPSVTYLGKSGDRYYVHLMQRDGANRRVLWITPDEKQKVLVRGIDASLVRLSDDGQELVTTPAQSARRTTLRVLDARTGDVVRARTFPGVVDVLDADESRAVLGSWSPNRTFWWNYRTNGTKLVNHRPGYFADIRADRVASYTRDPYLDGCSVLTDLRSHPHRLSKSCSERVVAVNPSGRRVATVGILSDGPGSSAATVRRASGGAPIVRYEAPYVFGRIWWQDNRTLLLETLTTRKITTVRCVLETCERASRTRPSPIV
ncbi:MAG TPA: hypothetical protein VFT70_02500 [Nocardioides sp.]|nr:hypothetical protein [Nocardioides sp.]